MASDFHKRRIFITEGGPYYQVFSFSQSKSDASIYVSSPSFAQIQWQSVSTDDGVPRLTTVDSSANGKLSVHASGVVGVRGHSDGSGHDLRIRGNYLRNLEKQMAGVRHLFTILMSEPTMLPVSPAFRRRGDYSLKVAKLAPYVLIFFAVPRVRHLTVEVACAFNADDLESVPPDSGFGSFNLILHSIMWFGYRTRHMGRWPAHPQVCYYDGHLVPVMIGIGDGACRLELRTPVFKLTEAELSIGF